MTLVLSEIHIRKGLLDSVVVAAADRRITREQQYDSTRKKLFNIRKLNAAISYYGLAEVYPARQRAKSEYLSSWLPTFIKNHSDAKSMEDLALSLREELHKIVPKETLARHASGFHICGFNEDGFPDFFHLTNVTKIRGDKYAEVEDQYQRPSSDFLGRDARKTLDWDGQSTMAIKPGGVIYRNGDFKSHALAAELLDEMLERFFTFPDFRRPKTPEDHRDFVKFKLEVIAYTYKKWAKSKLIGRPIDVIVRTKARVWATSGVTL